MDYRITKKGFTFAEIMVSALIFAILVVAILSVLTVGQKAWHADTGKVELQQEARLAMDGMIREIRESNASDMTISDNGSRIDFSIPDASETIAYYAENNNIIREYPAETQRVLAEDVDTVNFSLSEDSNVLSIELGLARTVYGSDSDLTFSLTEKVRLRNE